MQKLSHLAGLARALLRRRSPRSDAAAEVNLWCRGSTLLVLRERENTE